MAASVTTIDGMRNQATKQAVDGANRGAGREGAADHAADIGAPAAASAPANTLQTANVEPTEMSISPVRMTSVAPIAAMRTGSVREDQVAEIRWLEEPGRCHRQRGREDEQ